MVNDTYHSSDRTQFTSFYFTFFLSSINQSTNQEINLRNNIIIIMVAKTPTIEKSNII